MKTIQRTTRATILVAITAFFILGAASTLSASPYRHDSTGYWDSHHRHHAYVYHNHHRGYWGTRNGVRIFVNL